MISQSVLACQPKIKAHSFSPSEDDPKEFILIANDNGVALGITHAEKRLLELINGKTPMSNIIERVIHERIAPLSTLRRLIWDLYRYGLLENSPWEIEEDIEGWGYWGKPIQGMTPFWITPILGSWDKTIGRIMKSYIFHGLTFLLLAFSLWAQWDRFGQVTAFTIQNSVPMGILVVLFSILGGTLVSLWFGSMVLRSVHPSPVRCVADYRYALPIFRLDGRCLRSLPTRKALHIALSPLVGLLFVSSLFLWGTRFSEGARLEGLLHISVTLWFTIILLLTPWNSTLLSRDILMRLRGDSIVGLVTHAVRRVFHFFLQFRFTGEAHEMLLLAWGAWAIGESVICLRLAAFIMQWKLPNLIAHFMSEENRFVLILLFALLSVLSAALIATLLSFFLWLIREIIREIHHRYWPERDFAILGLGVICGLLLMGQYFWAIPSSGSLLTTMIPIAVCGGLLVFTSILSWRNDGPGYEPSIHLFPFVVGILLIAQSMIALYRPAPAIGLANEYQLFFEKPSISNEIFFQWIHHTLLGCWMIYLIFLYGLWFRPIRSPRRKLGIKILMSGFTLAIGIASLYGYFFSSEAHGDISRFLVSLLFVCLGIGSIWVGWILNYSTATICSGSILIYWGILRVATDESDLIGSMIVCTGSLAIIGGFLLRHSAKAKTSLQTTECTRTSHRGSRSHLPSVDECQAAMHEMYSASLRVPLPTERTEDSLRVYFAQIHRYTGTLSLHAIMRRAIRSVPWFGAKDLIKLFPASIPAPRLTDWTIEKVEQWLRQVPSFANLGKKEMSVLASRTRLAVFKPGERLIHQGKPEQCMFVLAQGNIVVEIERLLGNRILAILSAGDYVGEIAFLCGTERTATVRAITTTLLLSIHREDIDDKIPTVRSAIQKAEAGDSWIKAFSKAMVFNEFPPSLCARICLESRQVQLERGESLWLESSDMIENMAVLLQGKGSMIKAGETKPLSEGALIGLDTGLANKPMQGMIRAEDPSRIMLVERSLFREALAELLTPSYILKTSEEAPNERHPSS